jgi:hypothetical protein
METFSLEVKEESALKGHTDTLRFFPAFKSFVVKPEMGIVTLAPGIKVSV